MTPVIPAIVSQHLADAAGARAVRSVLVRAPHVTLYTLARSDERLAANLDGLTVAGEHGARMAREALASPGVGALFVATVLAIEQRDTQQLSRLIALIDAVPAAPRALASAFGWVSAPSLRGLTAALLNDASPASRWLGIAACTQHRVDPGAALVSAMGDPDDRVRARALRAAGELGRIDLLPMCLDKLADENADARFAAAWSAVLLGDRQRALAVLNEIAIQPGPLQNDALAVSLWSATPDAARRLASQAAANGAPLRTMIKAAGWTGDAQAIAWLLQHMHSDLHARLAGEAFSFITGADLAVLHLAKAKPERLQAGPNDDPNDVDVSLDEDVGLPWPDADKLAAWWHQNAERFDAGQRYFVGERPTPAHAARVLKTGKQRHRAAAAAMQRLVAPGLPLFNCAAPADRQERWLAA